MVLIAVVAIAAQALPPEARTASPAVQAIATVRIVRGARLSFAKPRPGDGFKLRDTIFRTARGTQPAKLIEFE